MWAFTLQQSQGFTGMGPTVITIVALAASFVLLSISMKTLPLGTALHIWTGIGAVDAFVVGVVVFASR